MRKQCKKREPLPPDRFSSERELCDLFRADAKSAGWDVYPEQGGWDMLLVHGRVQVGVQAKLLASVKLLLQASPHPDDPNAPGPHFRAVLFERPVGRTVDARGTHEDEIYQLAAHMRLIVLRPPTMNYQTWTYRHPPSNLLRYNTELRHYCVRWQHYRRRPERLVWTPPFVPNLPAGVASPKTAGPWQVAAVRLEIRCEERGGWVCKDDAIEMTTSVDGTWNPKSLLAKFYKCTGEPIGDPVPGSRQTKWRKRPRNVASRRYPEVMAAIHELEQQESK